LREWNLRTDSSITVETEDRYPEVRKHNVKFEKDRLKRRKGEFDY
jgi:hypothetical protein